MTNISWLSAHSGPMKLCFENRTFHLLTSESRNSKQQQKKGIKNPLTYQAT